MRIERTVYLNKLMQKRENGLIKVITGIRGCGKSYLLFEIFKDYLLQNNVEEEKIIGIHLDKRSNDRYRDPLELDQYIRSLLLDKRKMYYIFLDEIHNVRQIQNPYIPDTNERIGFVDVVLGLMKIPNVDLYITGSHGRMLSSDIPTEFRDRGDEIRVYPLSYKEFHAACQNGKTQVFKEFCTYGGLPILLEMNSNDKEVYLKQLVTMTFPSEVTKHYPVHQNSENRLVETLILLSEYTGAQANATRLVHSPNNRRWVANCKTVGKYLDCFLDSFIVSKSLMYHIQKKRYIKNGQKYYFADVGLRNACLDFDMEDERVILENILFNELLSRGYSVDVGMANDNYKNELGKRNRRQLEVTFVANMESKRYYIQLVPDFFKNDSHEEMVRSLLRIRDSFKKIVIVKDPIIPWYDDNGIFHIGIEQFLLDDSAIDL